MNGNLMKSVRDRIGCMVFCEREGGPHLKAIEHPHCDACLRIVLAHCGEKAVKAGMAVHDQDDHWAKLWAVAIRRAFGDC